MIEPERQKGTVRQPGVIARRDASWAKRAGSLTVLCMCLICCVEDGPTGHRSCSQMEYFIGGLVRLPSADCPRGSRTRSLLAYVFDGTPSGRRPAVPQQARTLRRYCNVLCSCRIQKAGGMHMYGTCTRPIYPSTDPPNAQADGTLQGLKDCLVEH